MECPASVEPRELLAKLEPPGPRVPPVNWGPREQAEPPDHRAQQAPREQAAQQEQQEQQALLGPRGPREPRARRAQQAIPEPLAPRVRRAPPVPRARPDLKGLRG